MSPVPLTSHRADALPAYTATPQPLSTAERFAAVGRLSLDGFFCAKMLGEVAASGNADALRAELQTDHYLRMFAGWTGKPRLWSVKEGEPSSLVLVVGLADDVLMHNGEFLPLAFNRLVLLTGVWVRPRPERAVVIQCAG